jgi:hypothetical protein
MNNNNLIILFFMNHMWLLTFAGLLSYNIPIIVNGKLKVGYTIRAIILAITSCLIVPIAMFLPSDYSSGLNLIVWGICFIVGILFPIYGARELLGRFDHIFSKFTVKSTIRRGANTDIRNMGKEVPSIRGYNPLKYINLTKGIFIGLDEYVKPIYLKFDDWRARHFLIVGASRSGKGVVMQGLGVQSLMLGETLVVLDPKGDKYMPHIFKEYCQQSGAAYNYIDLTKDMEQINLIADTNPRDLKNCFIEAFSQREIGSESDVYRKNEQEFLENLSRFIFEETANKNLAQVLREYDIDRYTDNYKSSVSDLNKLAKLTSINALGNSLESLVKKGGCIYIVGDLLDETIKKVQRFIFCRIVQLARNYSNAGKEQSITVFADELVAHISRFVAESYTVSLGWGLRIISAIQDLKLLRGAPADLDPEFLKGAIFGNSQNKLFYRADDIDTADFLSDMTGQIIVEQEQKTVTRSGLNAEKLERHTRLVEAQRNYFDRNMILNLKQFESVFCASLPYRSTIACLCKTSPIAVNPNINGKQVISDKKVIANPVTANIRKRLNETSKQPEKSLRERIQDEMLKSSGNATNTTSNYGNNQEKSTSKPDYLF